MVRSDLLVGAGLVPARLAGAHKGRPYGPIPNVGGRGSYNSLSINSSNLLRYSPSGAMFRSS